VDNLDLQRTVEAITEFPKAGRRWHWLHVKR